MTPDQYCQQKAAASGSSFYYSFLFLPPERRRAITALYAFCREVDDVVDETSEMQLAAAKLAWWRAELANLERGNAQHPVTRALQEHKDRFGISAQRLNEIIDGMEMDLTQTRYLDWPALERYCYRVAGVVGLLAAGIFGYANPRTLDYAKDLGIAFQLTNIIRDVGEDARKNRIYLPMDELKRFEVPAADILNARQTPQFAPAHGLPSRARARLLRPGDGRAAGRGPPRAARRAHHGGDLPHAARGDRARRASKCSAGAPRSRRCASSGSRGRLGSARSGRRRRLRRHGGGGDACGRRRSRHRVRGRARGRAAARARRLAGPARSTTASTSSSARTASFSALCARSACLRTPCSALPLELRYAAGFRFRPLSLPAPLGLAGGRPSRAKDSASANGCGALRFARALKKTRIRARARHDGDGAPRAARPGRPRSRACCGSRCACRRSIRRSRWLRRTPSSPCCATRSAARRAGERPAYCRAGSVAAFPGARGALRRAPRRRSTAAQPRRRHRRS